MVKSFIKKNVLFLLMMSTIIVTRVILYFMWEKAIMEPQIADSWHHLYTGIILVLATLPFSHHFAQIIRAIGIGLFIDECIHLYHILFNIPVMDYWSWESLVAIIIGVFLMGTYYYKIDLSTSFHSARDDSLKPTELYIELIQLLVFEKHYHTKLL